MKKRNQFRRDCGYGITEKTDAFGVAQFHITKPTITVPAIKREYFLDGERMYECEGNRHFKADMYDKTFATKKLKVLPKNHKGDNPSYKFR